MKLFFFSSKTLAVNFHLTRKVISFFSRRPLLFQAFGRKGILCLLKVIRSSSAKLSLWQLTEKNCDVILVSLLLTLNRFHSFFKCIHCCHWTNASSGGGGGKRGGVRLIFSNSNEDLLFWEFQVCNFSV